MPQIRCPDCSREITLSDDDLTRIIECAACGADFGPLMVLVSGPPPAGPEARLAGGDRPRHRFRRWRAAPKKKSISPILFGTLVSVAAAVSVLAGVSVLVRTGVIGGALRQTETTGGPPVQAVTPGTRPGPTKPSPGDEKVMAEQTDEDDPPVKTSRGAKSPPANLQGD